MTLRDPIGFDEPPFTAATRGKERQPRAWDWPLTPAVLIVLAMSATVLVVLATAGWLL